MALSAFDDKSKKPRPSELKKALGRPSVHWDNLVAHLAAEFPPLDETWNFAGANWGWSLRLKQKKRTILYMTPCKSHFIVGFALGEKAVKALSDAGLPKTVMDMVREAKKYAEGRAIRVEVKNKRDLDVVKTLAAVKMTD
jgi:hypothetical protein